MRDITSYIDVAQITLYVFWAFFFGLIFWLRREDRREGYPLESDPTGTFRKPGYVLYPPEKTYHLRDGSTRTTPRFSRDTRPIAAQRAGNWPGAPLIPTGDPLVDGVGPAAWAERADRPDMTWDARARLVPSRIEPHANVAPGDPDPRGMPVLGADGLVAGTISDFWVDRAEHVVRYLEMQGAPGTGPLLIPMGLAKIVTSRHKGAYVKVRSLLAHQFANVPRLKSPDEITLLEEDRVSAYFAGGNLYATPERTEPLL